MKKKIFASIAATVMIVCMSATTIVSAATPWEWNPLDPPAAALPADAHGNIDLSLGNEDPDDDEDTNETPVYGYIGPDAVITDPDPADPDEAPEYELSGTEINVTVPMKIIWAAFASTGTTVTSPSYYIENNSDTVSLDVKMSSFEASSSNPDNAAVDPYLTLNLTGTQMSGGVFTSDGTTGTGATNVAFSKILSSTGAATGTNPSTWNFSLGGTYTGSFATAKQPDYVMSLKFSIH